MPVALDALAVLDIRLAFERIPATFAGRDPADFKILANGVVNVPWFYQRGFLAGLRRMAKVIVSTKPSDNPVRHPQDFDAIFLFGPSNRLFVPRQASDQMHVVGFNAVKVLGAKFDRCDRVLAAGECDDAFTDSGRLRPLDHVQRRAA